MARLQEIVAQQQKGQENSPIFMVGEQLKEIAAREPLAAEILEKDLTTPGMGLADAAKKLQEYSDKHHGTAKCYCITPMVAEKILREFYGLPARAETEPTATPSTPAKIDLSSFL